jgi:hypothetical protein
MVASSLTQASSPSHLAPMQLFPRHLTVNPLTGFLPNIWTSSTSILLLATASQLAATSLPLCLLIGPHTTTGRLAQSPSSTAISSLPFLHFVPKLAPSPINFDATATKSYLVVPYNRFSTPITPPLRQVQRDVNLPMAWWNPTGKLWPICPGPIFQKTNAPNILVLCHQAGGLNDEYDTKKVLRETCISLHACP